MTLPAAPTATGGFVREIARQVVWVRVALTVLAVVTLGVLAGPRAGAVAAVVGAAFVVSGWLQGRLADSRAGEGVRWGLIVTETALMGWALFLATPHGAGAPPAPMIFFSPAMLGLLCTLALNALTVRPAAIWISGASILALWTAARVWVLRDPLTLVKEQVHDDDYATLISYLTAVTRPHYFNKDVWVLQMACLAGCTVILGVAALRLNRLSRQAAQREATRAGLAAHFSAAVVEGMLEDGTAGLSGSGELTILDCDLTGFSTVAAQLSPEGAAELLRLYHGFVERRVFEAGGAVLKFTGDGVTAAFGLSGAKARSASAALACGRRLVEGWPEAVGALNLSGAPGIAVGVESGAAAWSVVGAGRALSLVVVGDAVQAAQRLQERTRSEGAPLLIGRQAADQAALDDPETLAGLEPLASPPAGLRFNWPGTGTGRGAAP